MGLISWLHHSFNPHCPECNRCESCDTLREQLSRVVHEKEKLLELFIDRQKPESPKESADSQPIKPPFIPWRIRQQMLEAEDREKARILKRTNEELEQELGINASGNSTI